ncbi:MAG: alpha/beta hydrolase family protein [Lysobacterales bacterium]
MLRRKVLVVLTLLWAGWGGLAHSVEVLEVDIPSHEITLAGSIVLPSHKPAVAAVVFVHGSGKQRRNLSLAKHFAENAIAALVYDKRGAGESGGDYESRQSVSEKNLRLLADDAAAALGVLQQHPATQQLPVGLTGISQAGWIVPLAAQQSPGLSFMVLWSGPVCKVSEEDIFSKYTADLDGKTIPSFRQALKARKQPYRWPEFLGRDTDPSDSLSTLAIPGLWVFGAQDGSVPVGLSINRLQALIAAGKPYEYVLYSGEGHNNIPATIAGAIDWIKRKNFRL